MVEEGLHLACGVVDVDRGREDQHVRRVHGRGDRREGLGVGAEGLVLVDALGALDTEGAEIPGQEKFRHLAAEGVGQHVGDVVRGALVVLSVNDDDFHQLASFLGWNTIA